ncbi:tRNA (guanine(37)-N1)-methyltransferase [Aplysia californica]|uniref:tRNA (guanine(37)-N1)-methyltransferase n=1 Tax=Aplysia californica TaxID=6500 RepID=A0ABM0K9S8_APLCA|nr:tRNA (guanine(37)-N1)-methyltransferase [Aplysia californica]
MRLHFATAFTKHWRQSARSLRKIKELDSVSSKKYYKIEEGVLNRIRYLLAEFPRVMMDESLHKQSDMVPPETVKGMTVLSREAFTKKVKIPCLKIAKKKLAPTEKFWKPLQLRCRGIKPIAALGDSDPLSSTHSLLLLDPEKVAAKPLSEEAIGALDLENGELKDFEIEFSYENWSVPDIMRAVLPSDADNVSSFTQIGHIAHLNLKPESSPFKSLIGQVILDKIPTVKTVVNKLNAIDNTFRNFQMELLAGEENYVAQLKEHNCTFELDFSKVYWNSRLSTEHNRVVSSVERESIVYDVFAGIGPFAVPLARKRRCTVFANDLNPSSFQYLRRNVELNKITLGHVHTYNLDGREFIRTVVRKDLMTRILNVSEVNSEKNTSSSEVVSDQADASQQTVTQCETLSSVTETHTVSNQKDTSSSSPSTYVIMNLPGLAVEFLDAFNSLLSDLPPAVVSRTDQWMNVLPTVFCYSFTPKTEDMEVEMRSRAETALGRPLPQDFSVRLVRNVAPKKEMVCLTFKLWPDLVLGQSEDRAEQNGKIESRNDDEPDSKRPKLAS